MIPHHNSPAHQVSLIESTGFAIEAIQLVDHFPWRNKKADARKEKELLHLNDNKDKKDT
jgi:hypothetical protein